MEDKDNRPDQICNRCGWEGQAFELKGNRCPKCGYKSTRDNDWFNGYDNQTLGHGCNSFNWNRK